MSSTPDINARVIKMNVEKLKDVEIISAIKEDHEDLKKFIKVMKKVDARITEKRKAYADFSILLRSHSSSEESALYQKCLSSDDVSFEANEGFVEHELAAKLMHFIDKTHEQERWEAQVKVLAEIVEHHIDEEESDFLPLVKKAFDTDHRVQMGADFLRLRLESQTVLKPGNAGTLDRQMH